MTCSNEYDFIFDLSTSNDHRFKLLIKMDKATQYETLKRLLNIYTISKVKKLEKFFLHICIYDRVIDFYIKQELLYTLLCNLTIKNERCIKLAYDNVLYLVIKKAFQYEPYWIMLQEIIQMCKNKECIVSNFKNIIILGFKKFKEDKAFKKIFSFLTQFKDVIHFEKLCSFIFRQYTAKLTIKDKLLLLQVIFKDENDFTDDLMKIAKNIGNLGLQLEACDILYLKGNDSIKVQVQAILESILPDAAYTNNAENVHLSSVVSSVDKTLELLLQRNYGKKAPTNLFQILNAKFNNEKSKGSLNRIFNYNFLKFSKHNLTLKEIMEHVFICMNECDHNLQKELYIRLDQELADMYDTCSNGYVTRLINVFSGFEIDGKLNLGITISYEDEIYAIFSNKVNNIIEKAPPLIKDVLLEELMVPTNEHEKRLNLIKYLRPFIPKIWNEIFEIFKNELTITDLDLYCRKITMKYDGCI